MNILAIDSSSSLCSVALSKNGQIILESKDVVRTHSQFILPMIKSLLEKANLNLRDLDLCVYGKGPGSFTGLRLVSSIIQGLQYSFKFNLVGISTMHALAQHVYEISGSKNVIICEDARMHEVYMGHYQLEDEFMEPISKEHCIAPSELLENIKVLENTPLLYGTGISEYEEFSAYPNTHEYESRPLASTLIYLAEHSKHATIFSETNRALPSYIRTPKYKKR